MGVHSPELRQRMIEAAGAGYDSRRRTGRTTRMLLEVASEILSDTKHIVVVALNDRFAREYQRRVTDILKVMGTTLQPDEKIEFVPYRDVRDHIWPGAKVFMDHSVYEQV